MEVDLTYIFWVITATALAAVAYVLLAIILSLVVLGEVLLVQIGFRKVRKTYKV